MKKIIFRHNDCYKSIRGQRYLPSENKTYLKNISEQSNLFGVIKGQFSDNHNKAEMERYIEEMSTPNRNIFRSDFHFTGDSAAEAGLNNLTDWENWVKQHIDKLRICRPMKMEDFEYLATVHMADNHPHIHIIWWDLEQRTPVYRTDANIIETINALVIEDTFHDKFAERNDFEDEDDEMEY